MAVCHLAESLTARLNRATKKCGHPPVIAGYGTIRLVRAEDAEDAEDAERLSLCVLFPRGVCWQSWRDSRKGAKKKGRREGAALAALPPFDAIAPSNATCEGSAPAATRNPLRSLRLCVKPVQPLRLRLVQPERRPTWGRASSPKRFGSCILWWARLTASQKSSYAISGTPTM